MKQFGYSTTEEDIKSIIKTIDLDNSGTIELDEFLNFIAKYCFKDSANLSKPKISQLICSEFSNSSTRTETG